MKPERQRIAIAEACGWISHIHHPYGILSNTGTYPVYRKKGFADIIKLPDFLNDLNAMHEAEKTLTDELTANYVIELMEVLQLPHAMRKLTRSYYLTATATAAQRAEAFLRAIGKWEESP